MEVAGAALLLAGSATRASAPALAGAALLAVTMVGAILTHVRIADPPAESLHAAVLGALAVLNVVLLAG